MTDYIDEINHPEIERIQQDYQSEIDDLKQQVKQKDDEFDELRGNVESSVAAQCQFLDKIAEKSKLGEITLGDFISKLDSFNLKSYQQDWDVISGISGILGNFITTNKLYRERIIVEKEIIEKEIVRIELPSELEINGILYFKSDK